MKRERLIAKMLIQFYFEKDIIEYYWSSFKEMMYMCCSVRRFILLRASFSSFPKWMRDIFGSLGVKNSSWNPEVVSKTRP